VIHAASAAEAVHVQSGVVVTAMLAEPPVESIEIGADDSETSHLTGVGPEATWDDSHPSSTQPNAIGTTNQAEYKGRIRTNRCLSGSALH